MSKEIVFPTAAVKNSNIAIVSQFDPVRANFADQVTGLYPRTVLILLFVILLPFNTFLVHAEPIPCDAEITDMTIRYGDFLSGEHCAVSPSGDTDLFRFSAQAGEKVNIRATEGSPTSACLELLGPDGMPTANGDRICVDRHVEISETIQLAGIYTIVISSRTTTPFAYGLVLERLSPPSTNAVNICFGCQLNANLDASGDIDAYKFLGTPGDMIRINATEGSPTSACLELFGPDGMPTANGDRICVNRHVEIDETVQLAGIHTIVISSRTTTPFAYSMTLQCIVGVCANLAFDYTKVWYDPTRSGQGVQIVQEGSTIGGAWYLYDANGDGIWVTFVGELSGTTVTADLLQFTGPALGTPWDPFQVNSMPVGTVTIDFLSESAALFEYTIDGVSGTLNLEPF